jgi:hypothetical protein
MTEQRKGEERGGVSAAAVEITRLLPAATRRQPPITISVNIGIGSTWNMASELAAVWDIKPTSFPHYLLYHSITHQTSTDLTCNHLLILISNIELFYQTILIAFNSPTPHQQWLLLFGS